MKKENTDYEIEKRKFIKEFGHPKNTMIPNWFQRLFLPPEYYLIREQIYADWKLESK